VLGTVAVAAGRGSAVTTGIAVFAGALSDAGWLVFVEAVGSFEGSSSAGAFAHPIATLKVSATPMTTAMKKTGASAKNRRKRATSNFVRRPPKKFPGGAVRPPWTCEPHVPRMRKSMKRKPKLTKRERQAARGGPGPAGTPKPQGGHQHQHIHCIACGKHLDEADFEAPATATTITCDHGSTFPTCVKCMPKSMALVKEHDEKNQPVKVASAWH
jgi:hypothetical protein